MKDLPFSLLKSAGWALSSVAGQPPTSKRAAWPQDQPFTVKKGESSAAFHPEDKAVVFHVCKRGQCEDFVVQYDDVASIRKLAKQAAAA